VRAEAGALSHQAAAGDRLLRRVSRPDDGRALAHRLEAAAEAPLLAAGAGRDACSLSLRLSRLQRRPAGEEKHSRWVARAISKRSCSHHDLLRKRLRRFCRADPGRGRLCGRSDDLHAGTAADLRQVRHPAGGRRGAIGVGRTGKWWAIEHTGVEPDIVCMAKGIASGMPLGVCMARAEIMDWVPGSHASTFGGNPVSIAAALATMDVLEREGIERRGDRRGDSDPAARLAGKASHRRRRSRARPDDWHRDRQRPGSRAVAGPWRDRIVELAFERGLLILGCGETSIRLAPPLIVNTHEARSRWIFWKSALPLLFVAGFIALIIWAIRALVYRSRPVYPMPPPQTINRIRLRRCTCWFRAAQISANTHSCFAASVC
jgi:hypothetical protein